MDEGDADTTANMRWMMRAAAVLALMLTTATLLPLPARDGGQGVAAGEGAGLCRAADERAAED